MSITISQLPALPTIAQQVVSSALANESPFAKRQIVISDAGAIAFSTTNNPNPSYGGIYLNNGTVATTITAVNTPVEIINNQTVSGLLQNFTVQNNSELKYTGTDTKRFLVSATCDVLSGANNQNVDVYVYKNGSQQNNVGRIKQTVSNGLPQSGTMTSIIELATNDVLSLWIENATAINNLTVVDFSLVVHSIN